MNKLAKIALIGLCVWRYYKQSKELDDAKSDYNKTVSDKEDLLNDIAEREYNNSAAKADENAPLTGLNAKCYIKVGNFGNVVLSSREGCCMAPYVCLQNNRDKDLVITGITADIYINGEQIALLCKSNSGAFTIRKGESVSVQLTGTGKHRMPILSESNMQYLEKAILTAAGKKLMSSITKDVDVAKVGTVKVAVFYTGSNLTASARALYSVNCDVVYKGLTFKQDATMVASNANVIESYVDENTRWEL